jgi:hypothetical protein
LATITATTQGTHTCTHLRPRTTFGKPSEGLSFGKDNRSSLGHHTLAPTFVPAPPLVRTTPATWGITYPPRPRPRFGASCAHTSQSSTDFSNRRLRRQAARPCVPVANSERSKLVQSPASSRKCRRSCRTSVFASQTAHLAERTSCNQERGASAPRGVRSAHEFETPKFIASPSHTRFANPRRAHARRSCACALAHRKNPRIFLTDRTRRAPRAGGVSPPWDVLGMRTRNAEIQRVCRCKRGFRPAAS